MESVNQILLILIKGCALLLGIMLLIGGGLCSLSIPFFNSENTLLTTSAVVGIIALLSLLIFLAIRLSFSQQIKHLTLLIGGLFLVGCGLCVIDSPTNSQALSGLFFIDIALMLTGYLLIRWILVKKRNPTV
jgi:hypothetical protein